MVRRRKTYTATEQSEGVKAGSRQCIKARSLRVPCERCMLCSSGFSIARIDARLFYWVMGETKAQYRRWIKAGMPVDPWDRIITPGMYLHDTDIFAPDEVPPAPVIGFLQHAQREALSLARHIGWSHGIMERSP